MSAKPVKRTLTTRDLTARSDAGSDCATVVSRRSRAHTAISRGTSSALTLRHSSVPEKNITAIVEYRPEAKGKWTLLQGEQGRYKGSDARNQPRMLVDDSSFLDRDHLIGRHVVRVAEHLNSKRGQKRDTRECGKILLRSYARPGFDEFDDLLGDTKSWWPIKFDTGRSKERRLKFDIYYAGLLFTGGHSPLSMHSAALLDEMLLLQLFGDDDGM